MKFIPSFRKQLAMVTVLITLLSLTDEANAQRLPYPPGLHNYYSLGINLPVAATGTFNVDASMAIGTQWTAHLPLFYNPFTYSNNKKYKNISAMPGLRYWFRRSYDPGFFMGMNYIFSRYNFSGIFKSKYRYDGVANGLGASLGYALQLGRHWNLELEAGAGIVRYKHEKYKCIRCGEDLGKEKGYYITPNKTALGIVYKF